MLWTDGGNALVGAVSSLWKYSQFQSSSTIMDFAISHNLPEWQVGL